MSPTMKLLARLTVVGGVLLTVVGHAHTAFALPGEDIVEIRDRFKKGGSATSAMGAGVRADFAAAKVRGTQQSPGGTGAVRYLVGRRFGYALRPDYPRTLYVAAPAHLTDLVTTLAMRRAN